MNIADGEWSEEEENPNNNDDPEGMDRFLQNDFHIQKHAELDKKRKEEKRRKQM